MVSCLSGSVDRHSGRSSFVSAGRLRSISPSACSASSLLSTYARKNPGNKILNPLAVNVWSLTSSVTVVCSCWLDAIWQASVRIQIISYKSRSAPANSVSFGAVKSKLGRMASCASCAPLVVAYVRGDSFTYSFPNRDATTRRADATASLDKLNESVRM